MVSKEMRINHDAGGLSFSRVALTALSIVMWPNRVGSYCWFWQGLRRLASRITGNGPAGLLAAWRGIPARRAGGAGHGEGWRALEGWLAYRAAAPGVKDTQAWAVLFLPRRAPGTGGADEPSS